MPFRKDRRTEIYRLAAGVMGSETAAKNWMDQPVLGLGRRIPAELIGTIAGARMVEDYLMQIEHGVYV